MNDHRVVLVGRSGDPEFAALTVDLRKAAIPFIRMNAETAAEASCTFDLQTGRAVWNGTEFIPTVAWIRHFSMRAAHPNEDEATSLLRDDSWEALVAQLATVSHTAVGAVSPGQLQQISDAARLGIRVPRTLVTNDLAECEPSSGGRLVVKTLDRHYVEHRPGRLSWFHPRIVPADRWRDFARTDRGGVPRVVQEYVAHSAEIRLYLVGGQAYAFSVSKESPQDIWLRPSRVTVRPTAPPPAALRAAEALARTWNIRYGAFDFLIDADGPVFLEVNAHGDWRWYESKAGVAAVSGLVGRTVADLHRSAAGQGPGPDLLTFLGART